MQPDLSTFTTPIGTTIGPRVIVEVKTEHDWDLAGREFGQLLGKDVELFGDLLHLLFGVGELVPVGATVEDESL